MLDMSWGEVLVIGGIALIVIGPKDLPRALRTVGNMVGKARRMAGEFQAQFNEAMREAELDEVRREFEGLNKSASVDHHFDPIGTIRNELKDAIETPPPAPGENRPADGPEADRAPALAREPSAAIPAPAVPPVGDAGAALTAESPPAAAEMPRGDQPSAKPAERPE
jgi:sec-independent protein translocase protein TatB